MRQIFEDAEHVRKHNVFGIQTGVAVSFLVKRHRTQGCRIFYARRPEIETAEDKLAFIGGATLAALPNFLKKRSFGARQYQLSLVPASRPRLFTVGSSGCTASVQAKSLNSMPASIRFGVQLQAAR